jgi:hypothetical protein
MIGNFSQHNIQRLMPTQTTQYDVFNSAPPLANLAPRQRHRMYLDVLARYPQLLRP